LKLSAITVIRARGHLGTRGGVDFGNQVAAITLISLVEAPPSRGARCRFEPADEVKESQK
jgi:hypothetical protein